MYRFKLYTLYTIKYYICKYNKILMYTHNYVYK